METTEGIPCRRAGRGRECGGEAATAQATLDPLAPAMETRGRPLPAHSLKAVGA